MKEVLEKLLPHVELLVEKAIEQKSDEVVELALAKVKELIPGQFDDLIIEQVKAPVKAEVKKFLLAQAEKISAQ